MAVSPARSMWLENMTALYPLPHPDRASNGTVLYRWLERRFQVINYRFNSCSSELVDAPFLAKPRSLLGRMAKVALCQVSPKAMPGCIMVNAATASTIKAPSRTMRAISLLANFESKPACNSATR